MPSEKQQRRMAAMMQLYGIIRRATVFDPIMPENGKAFPGFRWQIPLWFETEAEAVECQKAIHAITKR